MWSKSCYIDTAMRSWSVDGDNNKFNGDGDG
jgi:hypothetical protein